jgi:hypothetical protein
MASQSHQGFSNIPSDASAQWLTCLTQAREALRSPKTSVREQSSIRTSIISRSLEMLRPLCFASPTAPTCLFLADGKEKKEGSLRRHAVLSAAGTVQGCDPHVTHILQGEVGFTVWPGAGASSSAVEGPSPAIMSTDATSCLVVACRVRWAADSSSSTSPAAAVVAMTHLDHGGPIVRNTLRTMLVDMAVPALVQLSSPSTGQPCLAVEWFLVGGMVDMKYAHGTLSDTFLFLHGLVKGPADGKKRGAEDQNPGLPLVAGYPAMHYMSPTGICVWDWNTVYKAAAELENPAAAALFATAKQPLSVCRSYGIIICARTGECAQASFAIGTRHFPGSVLRGLVHPPGLNNPTLVCPSASMPPVPVVKRLSNPAVAKLLSVPADNAESTEAKQLEEVTFASFLTRMVQRLQQGLPVPVLVMPSAWDQPAAEFVTRLQSAPDQDVLAYSTTPQCEPLDFCDSLRKSFTMRLEIAAAAVFGREMRTAFLFDSEERNS